MNNDKALTVVEQKDVLFYEDMITAVRASNGRVYVPIKPICDTLGIDWASQYQRINRDEVLIAEKLTIVVTTMDGRQRPAVCLPLDFVSGFLFTVSAQRVKPELKDRLVRYQRECYKVLSQAFAEGQLTASSSFDELLKIDSPAVQAYKMILAMAQMARQQIVIEARIEQYEGRLGLTEQRVTEVEERLENIEIGLGDPARHITAAQASQISQAVKAIGLELGKRSGRNEFGGVYGELYRRFNIAGYRELPAARFDEAMRFLRDWYQSLTAGADVPF